MKTVVIDIETLPSAVEVELAIQQLPPVDEYAYPANYRDPAKIAEYQMRKRDADAADITSKAALSPFTGRIACVCLGRWSGNHMNTWVHASPDEQGLLMDVREQLEDVHTLVTFNGGSFDLPFLRARMWHYGMVLPSCLVQTRKFQSNHVDVRDLLSGFQYRAKGTLSDWAALVVPTAMPVPHTAEDIVRWAEEENWGAIAEVCDSDVVATAGLYAVTQNFLGDEEGDVQ